MSEAPAPPTTRVPPSVETDARGIVDPDALSRIVQLNRYPAGDQLDGLVEWFWAVRWTLPPGVVHTQQVLTHPGGILSIGHGEADLAGTPQPPEGILHGVATRLSSRRLGGQGWTVAAMLLPGGLGALLPGSASHLTDRTTPLAAGAVPGLNGLALLADVIGADRSRRARRTKGDVAVGDHVEAPRTTDPAETAQVDIVRERLATAVAAADPTRVAAAREVAAAARLAETDRTLRRLEQLTAAIGVTARTLQRQFAEHAGVSPTWVIRRYRLLEAAELARGGTEISWARIAARLGYSDQAHLVRDFRTHLGTTPAAYAARQA